MPDTPTMAHQTRWAFAPSTGDPSTTVMTAAVSSVEFAVVSDTVKAIRPPVQAKGVYGHRGNVTDQSRVTKESYSGKLTFELTYTILQFFIERMMAGSTSSPWEPSNTLGKMFDYMRSDGATVYLYKNCVIEGWSIKGASGGFVMLELDIQAKNEIVTGETDAQAFDSNLVLSMTDAADQPIIAAEASLTIATVAKQCDDFELAMNHGVTVKHRHSLKPQAFLPGRRLTTFKTNTVWNATQEDIYYRSDEAGMAAVLSLVRGGLSAIFTMQKIVIPDNAPAVSGDDELIYGITGEVQGSLPLSTLTELSVLVDDTV